MDSLETKLQQLQTSYQQFYTTLGVENVWKKALDGLTGYVNQLNAMPKLFGKLPVSAISTIASMVNVIKNLLSSMLEEAVKKWQQFSAAPTEAAQQTEGQSEQAGKNIVQKFVDGMRSMSGAVKTESEKILNEAKLLTPEQVQARAVSGASKALKGAQFYQGKKGEAAYLKTAYSQLNSAGLVQGLNPAQLTAEQLRQKLQEVINKYNKLNGTSQQTGQVAAQAGMKAANGWERFGAKIQALPSAIKNVWKETSTLRSVVASAGMAVQGLAANIDQTTKSGADLAAGIQGLSSLMLAFSYPNVYLAAFTAGVAIINTISSWHKNASLDSQIERAEEQAEELNNQAILLKDNFKTLDTGIEKYEELKEKRYESAEAAEEYQEQVDSLAEAYPELIKGFDATGNAIIDASAAETALAQARKESAEATAKAAAAEAETRLLELKKSRNEAREKIGTLTSSLGRDGNTRKSWGNLLDAISVVITDEESGTELGESYYFSNYEEESSPMTKAFFTKYSKNQNTDFILSEENKLTDSENNLVINFAALEAKENELINTIQTINNENLSSEEKTEEVASALQDYYAYLRGGNDIFGEGQDDLIELYISALIGDDAFVEYQEATKELQEALKNSASARKKELSTNLNERFYDSAIFKENSTLASIIAESFYDEFLDTELSADDFVASKSGEIDDVQIAFESFYNNLTEEKRKLLDEMLENDNISFNNIVETFNIDPNSELANLLQEWYQETTDNWNELLINRLTELKLNTEGFNDKIQTKSQYDAYSNALEQFDTLSDKGYTTIANNYIEGFNELFSAIQDSEFLTASEKDAIFAKLQNADLTSYSGIFELNQELEEYYKEIGKELPEEFSTYLDQLRSGVVINLTLAFSALTDSLIEKTEEINEAFEKATEAMNFSDAFSLYEKIKEFAVDSEGNQLGFNDIFATSAEDPSKYLLQNAELLKEYSDKQIAAYEEEANRLRENINKADINNILELNYGKDLYDNWEEAVSANGEVLKPFEELGLQDEVLAVLNDEEDAVTKLENAINESANDANIAAELCGEAATELTKMSPIEAALAFNNFTEARNKAVEAYGEDSSWVKYINREAKEAYGELIDNYLSSTVSQFAKDAYKYSGDVLNEFNKIAGQEKSTDIVKELAFYAGYTTEELNDALSQFYEEEISKGQPAIQKAFADVLSNTSAIDLDTLESLANALGEHLDFILADFSDNGDGTYSASYSKIQGLMTEFGVESTSAIQDALAEYLESVVDILKNGLVGTMTATEFDSLSTFFGDNLNLNFTETAEGLKLTKQSAIDVYTELKKIDSIKAQLAFDELAESLEEVGSGYETVADTMRTIAELNKELANPKVSTERRKELEKELSVAEEILKVRSSDPDSFNFMDNDIPDGMQGPENYWNSVGDAYSVMNDAASSGYMEIQDYYNIINHMADMVIASNGTLEWMGMTSENASERAAKLIEAGMSALKNVDGEGVKVSLADIGSAFDIGAASMLDGFDEGIKIMAQGQIEMLDAAIRMLEAMVVMEEIDKNSDGFLSLGEIFKNGKDGEFNQAVITWANNLENRAGEITIGGKTFIEALESLEPEKAQQLLNQLYNLDWDLNDTDFNAQLQKVIAAFFPEANVNMGESVFDILKIPDDADKNAEHFQEWLENAAQLTEAEYHILEEALENNWKIGSEGTVFQAIERLLGLEEGDTSFENFYNKLKELGYGIQDAVELWSEITVGDNGKYIYNGNTYNSLGEALEARANELKGATTSITSEGTVEQTLEYSGITFKVDFSNEEPTYTASWGGTEYTGASEDDIINQIWRDNHNSLRTDYKNKEEFSESIKTTLNPEVEVTPIFTTDSLGENGELTQEIIDAYGIDAAQFNTISAALTAALEPLGETITTAIQDAFKPEEGETGIEVGELKITPTSIVIDTENATPTLGDENGVINVADLTISTEGLELSTETLTQIESYSTALSSLAALGVVSTGVTATATGVEAADTEKIESYGAAANDLPASVDSSITISATLPTDILNNIITLKGAINELSNNPEVEASFVASMDANSLAVVQNVLASYGYSNEVAELIYRALDQDGTLAAVKTQIDGIEGKDITITVSLEDSAAQSAIEELTEDSTKTVYVEYQPTKVGPETDTTTTGYPVYGIDNQNGNLSRVGVYDSAEQTIEAVTATIATGTFQDGTFEITEVKSDGSTVTITASAVDLTTGAISLGSSNSNNGNEGDTSGGDTGTQSVGLDLSGLTTGLAELETAAGTAAASISSASEELSGIDSSSLVTAAGRVGTLASAAARIPSNGAGKINTLATAINNLKSKTITADVKVSVSVNGPNAKGNISLSNGSVTTQRFNTSSHSMTTRLANAKGNALAGGTKRTLMGELGPELVVSGGRYFTVGNYGAEFVDLANDAIVFNHLQTKRLLSSGSSGRGVPITNERNATSFATGNAMASATAALAQLKQIRAMWQSLLEASQQDLASKAGSGGGGGGGGNDEGAVEYDLERWYNLLRQIEKLEQQITYEQAKRENMRSGYKYVDSLEKELDLLEKQLAVEKELASLQYDYYLKRMEDVNSSAYGKIFTYDEEGLMQYVDGENKGLDALAKLQTTDENGVLKMTAKQQLAYITGTLGVSLSDLKYKSDGTEAETDADKVQVFFDNVDSIMDELDELYDSYHEHAEKLEDLTSSQNEILQEYIDNQISLENKLLQAIEDREQAEIDRLQDEKDAFEEATQDYIDGLTDALNKEKNLYNNNQTDEETAKLQRRLAILQRSGGSASEIKSLQDQIDSRLQDAYFQAQQDQIDAIQEASDNQLEKLQTQIDLMTEALEYQKENGLLWNEVYEMMNQWTPEQMLQFIEQYTKSYKENSATQNQEDSEETLKEAEIWAAKRDKDTRDSSWESYYAGAAYDETIKSANKTAAQEAYNTAYASGGANAGAAAANAIFEAAQNVNSTETPNADDEEEEILPTQTGTISGGQMNVRSKASSSGSKLGIVKNGSTFEAVGYNNGWLKVQNAHTTKGLKDGYMKYKKYEKYYKGLNLSSLPSFSAGGDIDFTGLAMVHGSKNNPENILSAEHTRLLKEGIFSNSDHSLVATVEAIQKLANNMASSAGSAGAGIIIEKAEVNIQPGTISNDYDARRAGEMALEEMVKIARKTTNRVL